MNKEVQAQIIRALRENKDGLLIEDISQKVGVSRVTASKYLAILEAKGKVKYKEVGRGKLFSLKNGGGK